MTDVAHLIGDREWITGFEWFNVMRRRWKEPSFQNHTRAVCLSENTPKNIKYITFHPLACSTVGAPISPFRRYNSALLYLVSLVYYF